MEEVPCDLQTSDIADSLKDICLLLHNQKEPDKAMVRHRSLAYLSCHGAVKAGDSLNIRQMKQLWMICSIRKTLCLPSWPADNHPLYTERISPFI